MSGENPEQPRAESQSGWVDRSARARRRRDTDVLSAGGGPLIPAATVAPAEVPSADAAASMLAEPTMLGSEAAVPRPSAVPAAPPAAVVPGAFEVPGVPSSDPEPSVAPTTGAPTAALPTAAPPSSGAPSAAPSMSGVPVGDGGMLRPRGRDRVAPVEDAPPPPAPWWRAASPAAAESAPRGNSEIAPAPAAPAEVEAGDAGPDRVDDAGSRRGHREAAAAPAVSTLTVPFERADLAAAATATADRASAASGWVDRSAGRRQSAPAEPAAPAEAVAPTVPAEPDDPAEPAAPPGHFEAPAASELLAELVRGPAPAPAVSPATAVIDAPAVSASERASVAATEATALYPSRRALREAGGAPEPDVGARPSQTGPFGSPAAPATTSTSWNLDASDSGPGAEPEPDSDGFARLFPGPTRNGDQVDAEAHDAVPADAAPPSRPPTNRPPIAAPGATPGEVLDGVLLRLRELFAEHRIAVLAVAAVVLAVAVGLGILAASGAGAEEPAATAPVAEPEPEVEAPRAQPAVTEPAPLRTCSVATLAADPRLAGLRAQVADATTGEVYYTVGDAAPTALAEGQELLTAAAALAVLGADTRLETVVVKGSEPGSIVLVGGGDVTLSRTPTGSETVYADAAHLDALAQTVLSSWYADPANGPLQKLYLDTSEFDDVDWAESWDAAARSTGEMPRISALEVDGDREDPFAVASVRGEAPALRAGQAFASLLGIGSVEFGIAQQGAPLLGSVQSPSVGSLVETMLRYSDGALAESLARLTAVRAGTGDAFDAVGPGIAAGLAEYGVPTDGLALVDGSGLSAENRIPLATTTALLAAIERGDGALSLLEGVLPASGAHGSPAFDARFSAGDLDPAAVRGVPGQDATGLTSLVGLVRGDDGASLAVTAAADASAGDATATAAALDALVAGFAGCGANLAAD
ncbi:D-alanyl-D-alanine carboxypeptidase [Agromyces seonyuensis]|uniref:D-alanyl-D-alanine carboxypeptidase/D-alanyl-D-alanine-endopeptidase n=1 Tax=Agromyces seonyuensis TaxID=2662446 RepID=A0A6I4P4B5_9MICO|nr:D-alanyl-D-alanine carboxypeptidase [Agromyces seonyuensis]MWB99119.1 hypothetical protein [Agromyces seonyuensis]